jgi:hypothetical protein
MIEGFQIHFPHDLGCVLLLLGCAILAGLYLRARSNALR